jgi:hypothetical protein
MTSTTSPRRRLRASAVAAAAIAGLVFVLGACSGGVDDEGGGDALRSETQPGAAAGAPDEAAPERSAQDGDLSSAFEANADGVNAASTTPTTRVAERAVISTATISLHSDDVAAAMFDVQKVVDEYHGEIADEKTEGGEEARRSRLVIRVPSGGFDEAIADLKTVGEVQSSTRRSEDVTTTVIDNAARIRAQEESLLRVEVLLGRASSIRDIVAIESQLTRRQADLDSLKSQQAFLADQTSLSTITVHIERTPKPAPKEKDPDTDDSGFFAGLADGWDALTRFGTGLATVAGALLPFALLFGLLGVPAWLVARRLGRRRTPPTTAPAGP